MVRHRAVGKKGQSKPLRQRDARFFGGGLASFFQHPPKSKELRATTGASPQIVNRGELPYRTDTPMLARLDGLPD